MADQMSRHNYLIALFLGMCRENPEIQTERSRSNSCFENGVEASDDKVRLLSGSWLIGSKHSPRLSTVFPYAFTAVTASWTAVLRMLVGNWAFSAGSLDRSSSVARLSKALPIEVGSWV